MTRMCFARFTLSLAAAFGVASVTDALAQAWVPAPGEGTVGVAFQTMNVKHHLASTTRIDAGQIDTNVLLTDVSYGLTKRIAVDLALPFVSSRYTGNRPHPGTNVDDGNYRSTFTDFRFSMRYNLTRDGAVITPYVGTIMPSHDYAFYGHAANGQQLRELQFGVYAAKLFDRSVPGLFASGRYSFGFVEKVLDISHNRSSADLEIGYFFTPAFRAFAMANGQYSHGGIEFPAAGLSALPSVQRPVHDVIQLVHALDLGAGAAYSMSESFDVFGSFARLVAGRNGHALNRSITVGATWSFARKSNATDRITASAPGSVTAAYKQAQDHRESSAGTRQRRSLVRCICQKS